VQFEPSGATFDIERGDHIILLFPIFEGGERWAWEYDIEMLDDGIIIGNNSKFPMQGWDSRGEEILILG
jgi:hypothetical protein